MLASRSALRDLEGDVFAIGDTVTEVRRDLNSLNDDVDAICDLLSKFAETLDGLTSAGVLHNAVLTLISDEVFPKEKANA